jgi:hypothetical protein
MKMLPCAILIVASLLGARPASGGDVTVSPDTLARAQAAYAQVQSGKVDRSTLTPALGAELTDDIRAGMTRQLNAIAAPGTFAPVSHTDLDGVTTTVFRVPTASGVIYFTFGIDDATGKIAKLYFVAGPSV